MLSYRTGDLIKNVTQGTILHSCNSHGVMGAGFARQLREIYPKNYEVYRDWCLRVDHDNLGKALVIEVLTNTGPLLIINAVMQKDFATMENPRATSYDAVDQIFSDLYGQNVSPAMNDHVQMPRIGAGLGGGNWNIILEIILSHLPDNKQITIWDL